VTPRHCSSCSFSPVGNAHFDHRNTSTCRHEVILFGSNAFLKFGASIKTAIGDELMIKEDQEKHLAELEEQSGKEADAEHVTAQWVLETATKKMECLEDLYQKVRRDFSLSYRGANI
jgi:hypothetical protein